MTLEGARLGIMTADDFKNRTKATKAICGFASKFKGRGSAMARIDLALEMWDEKCNATIPTAQKLATVVGIVVECHAWLEAKSKTRFGKNTKLRVHRRQVITELMKSAKRAAGYLRNKVKTEAAPLGHVAAGLRGTYQKEREHYLASGKQNPYSASAVAEMNPDTFANLSYQQFIQAAEATDEKYRVEFMNRAKRMQHLLVLDDGVFLRDDEPFGSPQDQWRGENFVRLVADTYACDKYGNIFSKPLKGFSGTFFNHSSYCAGKEVICAGTLACIEGKLMYISTLSGHYKPPPPQMHGLLVLLAEDGVDVDNVCVEIVLPGGSRFRRGRTFLQNMQGQTDWPDVAGNDCFVTHRGTRYKISNPSG